VWHQTGVLTLNTIPINSRHTLPRFAGQFYASVRRYKQLVDNSERDHCVRRFAGNIAILAKGYANSGGSQRRRIMMPSPRYTVLPWFQRVPVQFLSGLAKINVFNTDLLARNISDSCRRTPTSPVQTSDWVSSG
jgi:hypothetical protein